METSWTVGGHKIWATKHISHHHQPIASGDTSLLPWWSYSLFSYALVYSAPDHCWTSRWVSAKKRRLQWNYVFLASSHWNTDLKQEFNYQTSWKNKSTLHRPQIVYERKHPIFNQKSWHRHTRWRRSDSGMMVFCLGEANISTQCCCL